jgi:MYXO-CTERM domain-containing protein
MMEVCNGQDDDCDGQIDNGAMCPMGYTCFMGRCDPLCNPSEFPCPGGFTAKMVNGQCVCVPDKQCNPPCVAPLFCDPSTGMCVDQCAGVKCPDGQMCDHGTCYGCEKFGCPVACTRCDTASHSCIADKCCNKQCAAPTFCDPATGDCIATCANGCPTGQRCDNGMCVNDPCATKRCNEGFACDPKTGNCVMNACTGMTCPAHLVCCDANGGAQCAPDPCEATSCPPLQTCKVDPLTCQAGCVVVEEKQEVLGAGGGGFGCSTGGRAGSPWQALALGAALLALLARRRR